MGELCHYYSPPIFGKAENIQDVRNSEVRGSHASCPAIEGPCISPFKFKFLMDGKNVIKLKGLENVMLL